MTKWNRTLFIAVCLIFIGLSACTQPNTMVSDESLKAMFAGTGMEPQITEFPEPRNENFPLFCTPYKILTWGQEEVFVFTYDYCSQFINEFICRSWKIYYNEDILLAYAGENETICNLLDQLFILYNAP